MCIILIKRIKKLVFFPVENNIKIPKDNINKYSFIHIIFLHIYSTNLYDIQIYKKKTIKINKNIIISLSKKNKKMGCVTNKSNFNKNNTK